MAAASDYLEEKILDSMLNNAAFPSNATVYVGLATTLFDDSGGGVEATGGSYARKGVTAGFTVDDAVAGTWTGENTAAIEFVEATGNWGTIVGFGLFDAVSGGNLLAHGALSAAQVVNTGNKIQFNATDLVFECQ